MTPDEQYRADKTASGTRFQDHVVELLCRKRGLIVAQFASREYQLKRGESLTGVEIKFDDKYAKTSNLWIEIGEKAMPRAGEYAPSGILRDDNTWLYVIGNYRTLFLFAKRSLVLLYESGRYPRRENERLTSVGFLLPDSHARRWAALIEEEPEAHSAAPVSMPPTAAPPPPAFVERREQPRDGATDEERLAGMVTADEINW